MNNHSPSVSCVLFTQKDLVATKRSIECFKRQTYPKKELLVFISEVGFIFESLQRHVSNINDTNIQLLVNNNSKKSIDQVISNNITSDFICNWDINYQYHPNRLETQLNHLIEQNADASFLVEELLLFEQEQLLFPTDWTFDNADERSQLIQETMLMKKNDASYPLTNEGKVVDQLLKGGLSIVGLSGQGYLAIRHSKASSEDQKQHLLKYAIQQSSNEQKINQQLPLLSEVLKGYWVPTPLGIYSGNQQVGIYNL